MDYKAVEKIIRDTCKITDIELDRTHSYTEANYQNALIHFLQSDSDFRSSFRVLREVHINYSTSDNYIFGHGRADIILESDTGCYILELKANVGSDQRHIRKYVEQCRRYIYNYSRIKSCVVNGFVIVFNSGCGPIIKKIL